MRRRWRKYVLKNKNRGDWYVGKKLNHLYPDENNYIDLEPQKPAMEKTAKRRAFRVEQDAYACDVPD